MVVELTLHKSNPTEPVVRRVALTQLRMRFRQFFDIGISSALFDGF